MDHRDGAPKAPSLPAKRGCLGERPFVSLAEALTWIAFGDALSSEELRAQVEGQRPPNTDSPEERLRKFFSGTDDAAPEVPGAGHFRERRRGLELLAKAWQNLRDGVDRGTVKVRGRLTSKYSLADAHSVDAVELTGNVLAAFSQFDVSTGGIRRQTFGSPGIIWRDDPHSFDREFDAYGDDASAADGYLMVEVEREGLMGIANEVRPSHDHATKNPRLTDAEREPVLTRTGDPGRPSKGYQIYDAEHARRCDAGEAHSKIADEARHLVTWFKEKLPGHDPISSGTVENRIRPRHLKYRAHKKSHENNDTT
ncbi:MAG: hypothetical protein FP826_02225 [Sphingomonadales bacterium]|nr:hypothetical protein [Sphingomonadales bacterium]